MGVGSRAEGTEEPNKTKCFCSRSNPSSSLFEVKPNANGRLIGELPFNPSYKTGVRISDEDCRTLRREMDLDIPRPTMINEIQKQLQLSYRIRDMPSLGRGGFSLAFSAEDLKTGKIVALKKSRVPFKVKRPMLQHESRILQMLQGHPAIPEVYGYGQLKHFEYISMEVLGPSVRSKVNGGLTVITVVRIVEQALSALKHIHKYGLVHRDIKPENLLCSNNDPSKIMLIDFGLTKFTSFGPPRRYDPLKEKKHIMGTVHWASLNSHRGIGKLIYLGPGDDLESLAYTALFLLRGNIPWRDVNRVEPVLKSQARVFKIKSAISSSELVMHFPTEFAYLLDYSRELDYPNLPDYPHLEECFSILAESLGGYSKDDPLDWTTSVTDWQVVDQSNMDEEDDAADYEGNDDGGDSHDNSYFNWDIDCWDDIHKSRDLSLTLPNDVEVVVDSQMPRIVEVIA